jgi:hypothetical protein
MEAMENAIRLRALRGRGEPTRPLGGTTTAFPTASLKIIGSDVVIRGRKTRFGLGTLGHVSENPWVMILKNHTIGEASGRSHRTAHASRTPASQ